MCPLNGPNREVPLVAVLLDKVESLKPKCLPCDENIIWS